MANPSFLSEWLAHLDFTEHKRGFILPPVCDVPAGSFLMGSNERHDKQAWPDERPQHSVTLTSFQVGKFPVTVTEYACAVRANVVKEPAKRFRIDWKKQLQWPNHSVTNVSWSDALAYTSWLAKLTGDPWRLLTEAEWEKAARGIDGHIYPWGNYWDETRANFGGRARTQVGAYPSGASPYGVQDMLGNVWEWCSSLYTTYPYRADDGRENLSATGSRVLRGGSWVHSPRLIRAACRGNNSLGRINLIRGFRLGKDM